MSEIITLVEAIKIMLAREFASEYVPQNWDKWLSEAEIISVASRPAGVVFVNVHSLDRHYGGSEEGGWWYDSGSAELSIQTTVEHCDAIATLLEESGEFPATNNRGSVIYYRLGTDYRITVQDCPAEDWSDYRPWE